LLASEVRNVCRSVVLEVLEELPDDPSAASRFWKSVDNELSLDDEPVVLDDEVDVNDCARLSIADARPPP
jgi:hypothetical protein